MKRVYGLLGKDIGYSFSPEFFNQKFSRLNLDAEYRLFDMKNIEKIDKLFSLPYLCGFNVTIPYKSSIIPLLDFCDKSVDEIGACNVVKIMNGKSYGFNTDYIGFKNCIKKHPIQNMRALILGNGGASKSVQYALQQLNISYSVVSRKPIGKLLSWQEIDSKVIQNHQLIINTTPLGSINLKNDSPLLPYEAIGEHHIVIDLIYNPMETHFLRKCRERKATTENGLCMLLEQAEACWEIWQHPTPKGNLSAKD